MSNFFKCCVKDPKGSFEKLTQMDNGTPERANGYFPPTPDLGEELAEKPENSSQKLKPNLRIKVPQSIRLKNYVASDENFDGLHSNMGEVTGYVSTYFFVFSMFIFRLRI